MTEKQMKHRMSTTGPSRTEQIVMTMIGLAAIAGAFLAGVLWVGGGR